MPSLNPDGYEASQVRKTWLWMNNKLIF
jgi:hypothetical protein